MTRTSAFDLESSHRLAVTAARAAAGKKADDTVILAIGKVLPITDAFVITSASNDRLVRAIVEEIEAKVKAAGGPAPLRVEGLSDARWVLMDYGDVVVHVFLEEAREYYDLERLWTDAPRIPYDERTPAAAGE